jgi:hypothetical protein
VEEGQTRAAAGATHYHFSVQIARMSFVTFMLQVAEEEKAKADAAGPKKGKGVSGRQVINGRAAPRLPICRTPDYRS